MTAQAVREKGGAFDAPDGGTGIDALVQHINKKEWAHACERLRAFEDGPGASIDAWAKFLCLATMCGGLKDPPNGTDGRPLAGVRAALTEALGMAASLNTPAADVYGNGERYALLVSGAHQDDAPKLEPDVLGEGFVLNWLMAHARLARPLIDAAWTLGMTDFVRRAAENFPARAEASGLLDPVASADPAALAAAHMALGVREYASGGLAALRARGKRLLTTTQADGQSPLHPPRVRALGTLIWMQHAATREELEQFSAALDGLPAAAELDAPTRELLAAGLFNAFDNAPANSARSDEMLARLQALADAHPLDAAVREQLAMGLFNAFNNAPANSERADNLLARLQALADATPLDAAVREQWAKPLTNAIAHAVTDHARADDMLARLQALADAHPLDAAVREPLASGLTNAIAHAAADHARADVLLIRLQALADAHPLDAAIRELLAMGLFNAFKNAPANSERADNLLARLQALADAHPLDAAVREQLAKGLFNAFHNAPATSASGDILLTRLQALADAHPLDAAVREQLAKGLFNAFNNAPANSERADNLLARLQALADAHPLDAAVREQLAKGLFNAFKNAPANSERADVLLTRLRALAGDHPLDAAVGRQAWKGCGTAFGKSLDPCPPQPRHLHAIAALLPPLAGDDEVRQMSRAMIDGVTQMIAQTPVPEPRKSELDAALKALSQAYQESFGPDDR